MINESRFPEEIYINIENEENFIGRITLYEIGKGYHAEIDIIHDETKKIFHHVDDLYNQPSAEEALELAIQRLSTYLLTKR